MIRETGRVWSGAVMTPRDGHMFVGIRARWQVPEVKLPRSPGNAMEADTVCSSSTWIGLDGTRRYLHSSLPQIGTVQSVIVTDGQLRPYYFAFYEWWFDRWWQVRTGNPFRHGSPRQSMDLWIDAHHWVECTLRVTSRTKVTLKMKNLTTGKTCGPIDVTAPTMLEPGDESSPFQFLVSGATAEWITERPSNPETREPYELADYGEVVFEDCEAITALDPVSATCRPQTLAGGCLALRDMVHVSQNRARRISRAQLRGCQSVATLYGG